jgi:hypothetical protein
MVLIVSIGVAGRAGLPVRLASAESDKGDISAGILSSNCLFGLGKIMRLFRQLINAYLHLGANAPISGDRLRASASIAKTPGGPYETPHEKDR